MKSPKAQFASLALLGAACSSGPQPGAEVGPAAPGGPSQGIVITRSGSRPSSLGPAEWFTGSARIEPLIAASAPSRTTAAGVTFEPGARTAWHTHLLGQSLIVTDGVGWVQGRGGPVLEVRPGDVVWTPPGVKHWHGATATTGMTHIAVQDRLDGQVVEWMEHVTDEEYGVGATESPATEAGRRGPPGEVGTMEIRLTVNGKALEARLVDSPAARDFASLLPLTLTMNLKNARKGPVRGLLPREDARASLADSELSRES